MPDRPGDVDGIVESDVSGCPSNVENASLKSVSKTSMCGLPTRPLLNNCRSPSNCTIGRCALNF